LTTKLRQARHRRVIFCELKALGGSSTQWSLESYNKVDPTSLFAYDIEQKS